MADFLTAHRRTARFEGGYQCMREDNGNWTGGVVGSGDLIGTKYGISAPLLGLYLGRRATATDMKTLQKETAEAIYRKNYWAPIKGDLIEDQAQADQLYDMGVNAGVKTAIILAQRTLGLPETGVMDATTLHKINHP